MTLLELIDFLGEDAKGLSDEEILKRRDDLEQLLNLLFDLWLNQRNR
jgi:hypothetical protein